MAEPTEREWLEGNDGRSEAEEPCPECGTAPFDGHVCEEAWVECHACRRLTRRWILADLCDDPKPGCALGRHVIPA